MKLINYFAAALAVIGIMGINSCTDLSDIENRLDVLESEICKFDTLIANLNTNVETLYYLKDGKVITAIKETEEGWDLTLSDGRELSILNGNDGNSPVVSISDDGYWVIDGVKQSEKASATDGKTPQFGVDNEGYWTVAYDGGTPARIKDAEGNDVPAKTQVTGGDSYFASVEVEGNCLVLQLRDYENTVISVPIVKGFSFIIKKNGAIVEGIQKITEGTSVTFDVEQSSVASAAIVTCPAGFKAELTDNTLTVTAVVETKASASTEKDLAILAVSNTGISTIAKIQVEKTEPQPEATLTNVTHECYSFNSVKLNASVVNADRIHCIIKAASENAATADELKAKEAVETTEGAATLNKTDLTAATEYVAYFIASDGTKYSDVQTFGFSTRAIDDNNLYEKYAAGQTITVAGLEISKTTHPEALYICRGTTTRGVAKSGLCFVESHDDVVANFNSGIINLITIGTNPTKRANVTRASGKALLDATAEDNDYMVLANLKYTVGAEDFIFQLNKADDFETIQLENCYIEIPAQKTLLAYVNNDRKITDFKMTGCDCKISTKGFLIQSRNTAINSIDLQNNVIFADQASLLYLLDYTGSNLTNVTTINIDNNTFYNVSAPASSQGYLRAQSITNVTITDNLFYDCQGASYNTYIYYSNVPVTTPNASANVSSVPKDSAQKVYIVNGTSPTGVTNPTSTDYDFPLTDWKPAEGSFKINGTYKEVVYGATR